jgi:hypothetical protein
MRNASRWFVHGSARAERDKIREMADHGDDVDEVVRCLAGTSTPSLDLRDGRYAVVRFGFEDDNDFDDGRDQYLGESVVRTGEALSLLGAFDLLAAHLYVPDIKNGEHFEDQFPEDCDLASIVQEIAPARRPVVCLMLGCFTGPMDICFDPDGFVADDDYLGEAPALLGDARFVFLASVAHPLKRSGPLDESQRNTRPEPPRRSRWTTCTRASAPRRTAWRRPRSPEAVFMAHPERTRGQAGSGRRSHDRRPGTFRRLGRRPARLTGSRGGAYARTPSPGQELTPPRGACGFYASAAGLFVTVTTGLTLLVLLNGSRTLFSSSLTLLFQFRFRW